MSEATSTGITLPLAHADTNPILNEQPPERLPTHIPYTVASDPIKNATGKEHSEEEKAKLVYTDKATQTIRFRGIRLGQEEGAEGKPGQF